MNAVSHLSVYRLLKHWQIQRAEARRISILDIDGQVYKVPLDSIYYIGVVEKRLDEWEICYRVGYNNESITASANEAILLLIKLAREFGVIVDSNMA